MHCSLIIPMYPWKYTIKCLLIVDNYNTQKSSSLQLILVFTVRLTQKAAGIWKMEINCITTQQIEFQPVDGLWSVSKSGIKSLLRLRSLAYASRLKLWPLGSGECIYTYPGGTPSISVCWLCWLWPAGLGGVLGRGGACRGGGALVRLRYQPNCRLVALPYWQARQPSVWFSRIIPGVFLSSPTPVSAQDTQLLV